MSAHDLTPEEAAEILVRDFGPYIEEGLAQGLDIEAATFRGLERAEAAAKWFRSDDAREFRHEMATRIWHRVRARALANGEEVSSGSIFGSRPR